MAHSAANPIFKYIINPAVNILSLTWLTGPIFDKELRVSSRRRRNYLLRSLYLLILLFIIVLIWIEEVRYSGRSASYRASRMSRAGISIIMFIVWFQFLTSQLIVGIIMSTSISDEIYNKTLGVLMTTPINAFQIVMGKLCSKLLQVILLLAISLPLLAIVRVFGGIPWNYIIAGLCITLTTVIFIGSVSMFFSIFSKRAYVVIIWTVLTMGFLFGVVPLLVILIVNPRGPTPGLLSFLSWTNPYFLLGILTETALSPRRGGMPFTMYSWSIHCGVLLAASGCILALCMKCIRKTALSQIAGRQTPVHAPQPIQSPGATVQIKNTAIRTVNGPPVMWKELKTPLFGRHKLSAFISIFIGALLLLILYGYLANENQFRHEESHMTFSCIYLAIAMFFTTIIPATVITSEKEARSWPILLATPQEEWQIIFGKFAGIVKRCLPIWGLLFGHISLFVMFGYIHPIAMFMTAILVFWIIVFLAGSGIYFSTRFKKTTTAVIMNLALVLVIWGAVPLLMAIILSISHGSDDLVEAYMDTHPFAQIVFVMDGTAGSNARLQTFRWANLGSMSALESTAWMIVCAAGYTLVGLSFGWMAKYRMRRKVF